MCGLWHGCKYKWRVVAVVVIGGLRMGGVGRYEILGCVYFVRLPTPRDTPSTALAVHYRGITYQLITRTHITRHLYKTVITREIFLAAYTAII